MEQIRSALPTSFDLIEAMPPHWAAAEVVAGADREILKALVRLWDGWGPQSAARALQDFGHPQGSALVEEAAAYRQDILGNFRAASVRSPVVRLRDGTYIPQFPSNIHTRGRW